MKNILESDASIGGAVNVVVEDIYTTKTKDTKVGSGSNNVYSMNYRRYSLAQYYVWPEARNARLANLRGEQGTSWDYIILMADPYLLANMPGVFAEGVDLLTNEIAKGGAEPILFAQWPESGSNFTVSDFNEVVHRIAESTGIRVIPAGKAWQDFSSQEISTNHPTPHGAYLSAASMYSKIYNKSAKSSSYVYSNTNITGSISEVSFNTMKNNENVPQYSGIYTGINPFQMLNHSGRNVDFCETGSSTENGIKPKFQAALSRVRMSNKPVGRSYAKSKGPIDLNYGRGNDWYEDNKDYEVNPDYYNNTIGFPMQDNHGGANWAPTTMLYGIDKRYHNGSYYTDATDLGIAYNMIRPGTREQGVPLNVRSVPVRLMWSRIYDADPSLVVTPDNNHMNGILLDAIGTYMTTILTGRCSVTDEPEKSSSTWNKWYARKVAYETAWRMSHLTTRTPGFKVLPSSVDALTISNDASEKLTVSFMFPPKKEVTVLVSSSNTSVGIVGPQKLVFTPENYNVPQSVRVKGVPGSTVDPKVNIQFTTVSEDVVYNGLTDSWRYTHERFSSSVTHNNKNTIAVETYKNIVASVNLNTPGILNDNTELAGPNHGSLFWNGANIEYTPNTGFTGSDGFAYWSRVNNTIITGYVGINVLDEVPMVDISLAAVDSDASEEGLDDASWTITRTGNLSSPLEVNFSVSGTAAKEYDYVINSDSPVIIPAGKNSVDILLSPIDDIVSGEEEETVVLTILQGAGYQIIDTAVSTTITDNDEPLSIFFTALNSGDSKVGDALNMDVELLGTLTDANELQFLVKKGDTEFSNLQTVNIGDLSSYLYSWRPTDVGTYSLKVIATNNGNYVTHVAVGGIVVRESLKMAFTSLKEGASFNTGNKIKMHTKLSGDYASVDKVKFSVQKIGASSSVVKTLSVSGNKTTYKNRWTAKTAGDYILKVSAYSNNVHVEEIKVNISVENPLKLKYKILKNGQSYAVGDDVKMHVRVSGDMSKADEIRFIVQKTGGISKVDKTDAINPSKPLYYNKWIPSSAGEYRLKAKAYKNGKYVKMTSAKINVAAQKMNFRAMTVDGSNDQIEAISVYPNPNSGIVNINFGSSTNAVLKVYSASGQIVYQQNGLSGIYQFELKSAPGLYFVEVDSETGKQIFKVVKN